MSHCACTLQFTFNFSIIIEPLNWKYIRPPSANYITYHTHTLCPYVHITKINNFSQYLARPTTNFIHKFHNYTKAQSLWKFNLLTPMQVKLRNDNKI